MIGTDGTPQGRDAVVLGMALSELSGAEVVLVHAYPPAYGATGTRLLEQANELLAEARWDARRSTPGRVVADESPAHALHEVAVEWGADLIVVGASRHGVLGRLLLGDVARATLRAAPCAVAVAPRGLRDRGVTFGSIAVGFVDTPEGRAALTLAAELARVTATRHLRLVTVVGAPVHEYEPAMDSVDWGGYLDEASGRARRDLDEAVAAIDLPGVEGEVRIGRAVSQLVAVSEMSDLLLLGSRGWGSVRRVILGSTSEGVVRSAFSPVIVCSGAPTGAPARARAASADA